MKILHLTDIHFCLTYEPCDFGYKGMMSEMENPLIYLKNCLNHVLSKTKLDLVLISGDLTEDGSPEDYRFLKMWLENELGEVPIVVTLGNHDIKTHFRQGWLEEEGTDLPYNVVKNFTDFVVISLDNAVYGLSDGHLAESQFQWLESQLKGLDGKPIFLMTHHHLIENQSSVGHLPESKRLLYLIKNYSVTCVLNGHTHHAYTADIEGIQYYTGMGMSFVGEDEGAGFVRFDQRYGYNLYHVDQGKIIRQTTENFIPHKVIDRVNMRENH